MNSKFKEYIRLHFKMVPWYVYIIAACGGIAVSVLSGKSGFTVMEMLILLILVFVFPYFDKICSGTIYQKEAYFYMSFPVNAFQVVFSKTLVTATLIAMVPAGYVFTSMVMAGYYEAGFIAAAVLLVIASAFLISGIVVTGYRVGNNFRNQKKGMPNKIVAYLYIAVILFVIYMMAKVVFKIETIGDTGKVLVVAGISAVLGVCELVMNSYSVKKYYEA